MPSKRRSNGRPEQIIEVFPDNEAPRCLLRDRDGIYGKYFRRRVAGMGTEEVIAAPRSRFQSPYDDQLIDWVHNP